MLPKNKRNDKNNIANKNNLNIFPKGLNIYDTNKYGITKINNNINNNPFNIILLDKKSDNKLYSKKPSCLNLSIIGLGNNQETLGFKETRSENFDESCEKLHYRMNGLFLNKNILRQKSRNEEDNIRKSNSFIQKKDNNSISKIDNFDNINGKKDDKSSILKKRKILDSNINNKLSLTNDINGMEDIKTNINKNEDSLSSDTIKENLKIGDLMNDMKDINQVEEKVEKSKFKMKMSRSFNSYKKNIDKDDESKFSLEIKDKRKNSIISEDIKNYNNKNIFGSFNEILYSMNCENNKEYNFSIKENKRYKNIDEIKEDINYFRFLYLSSNLIDIIKKKKKYQLGKENNENKISDINNQNYYIYTNDRNVLKLTALYYQKVKKAINLFNSDKYEESYNSLIEDKIVKNKKYFALFLLIVEGINKEKLYAFLSKSVGINNNFYITKLYLSYFNFANQTLIISFNFLLESLNIPSNNNDDIISLFTEAYIKDNKLNPENEKDNLKKICGLVLKLNNIMNDPDEDKQKNKEEFINSNINDQTNWNPNLNNLISKDPSMTAGLMNYSHVCGFVFDEYIKNENSIPQQKNNQRAYKELLNKKILLKNSSFSLYNNLNTNEKSIMNSQSKLEKIPEIKRKNISIIANNKVLYKTSLFRKKLELEESKIITSKDGKEEKKFIEKNINSNINKMKKGEKIRKITNINGKTVKIILKLSPDENNFILKNELCCTRTEIISLDEIIDCNIGYSQLLKTNKNFENYMTIILNSGSFYEFYHSDKKVIENLINSLDILIKKRNKILTAIYKNEKISDEEVYNIWQNEFLSNWKFYRKYVIKKKNGANENEYTLKENDDKGKIKLFKIWSLGLPFWLRENMWKIIIGNKLNISLILFQGLFNIANDEYKKYKNDKNDIINGSSDIIEENNYNDMEIISKDCDKIIKRFKNNFSSKTNFYYIKKEISKIVRTFLLYRPDILYSKIISEFCVLFYNIFNRNEYETFVVLSNFIINNYFLMHIQNDTLFMKNQLTFFENLIMKNLPSIYKHFKELQFSANIFFYKWIEFLFLKTFNYKLCLRIIDNFLIKGNIFIFEISIATLYILQKEILNSDEDELVLLLKKKNLLDIDEDTLFKYIDSFDFSKEYKNHFKEDNIEKEKNDLSLE